MRLVGIAVGVGVALVLSGCGQSVDGQPEVSGAPLTKEQLFEPCGVPESALVAAGADPASKDDNPFSVPRAEWKGCGWRADGHFIYLSSTTHSMQEIRENDYFHDFQDVTIGGRKAVQYLLGTRTPPNQCEIAFDTSKGRVTVTATKFIDNNSPADPCVLVNEAAPHFVDVIPK
ncbi:DUF3558 domain-containing protein [Nocardia coubleae]|uniref:DUF3558 domain-containing protein n=1 Tax=Nocardia coubleae TaxID=356147 RepID=A0A846W706_9NOCA|nr:DUF3558 domain-containing protein [Nocardia coubleae]NKX88991.1 DUF3558 domain-containing protein [Nocardia coubleae]